MGIKVSWENFYLPREKDSNLLKGRCLWTVKSPNGVHLKLRDLAMSFVKFEVWDGKTVFLWHDNWHPIGTLSLEFGYSVIYAASKPEAKVVCFDF